MVALRRCVERVNEWRQRVQTALTSDSIAQVHRLITMETSDQEKPATTSDESPMPAEVSDPSTLLRTSPEFGKIFTVSDNFCVLLLIVLFWIFMWLFL